MTLAASPPAFDLAGLSLKYPGGATGLDRMTTQIPAGETVAVLGPSGSGKSTLLSVLGLLWDDTGASGTALFHDGRNQYDLLRLRADQKAGLRAGAFGFVLQSNYLLPHFSNAENVGMPLALHGWPAPARAEWVSALLRAEGVDPRGDLRKRANGPPRQVAGGQKQRFSVLRSVIADPLVVFADEPSSNLDPGSTAAMFDLLALWKAGTLFDKQRAAFAAHAKTSSVVRRWLAQGPPPTARTLMLVCHDVQTARRQGDRFLLLNQEHRLEVAFERSAWDDHADTVERVLGLPPGAAGRDRA